MTSAALAGVFCNTNFCYSRVKTCDADRCKRANVSFGKVCNTNAPKFGGGGIFHCNSRHDLPIRASPQHLPQLVVVGEISNANTSGVLETCHAEPCMMRPVLSAAEHDNFRSPSDVIRSAHYTLLCFKTTNKAALFEEDVGHARTSATQAIQVPLLFQTQTYLQWI